MSARPDTRMGLNPIARLAALASTCVVAFRARTPLQATALFCLILLVHVTAGAPLRQFSFRRRLRGICLFAAALFASQVLLARGPALAQRAVAGALMALRFLNVVLASHLFVSITEPERLAYAMMQAGLPYRYGFAFLAAMRFVPYFRDQAQTVRQAQMARGIALDRATPRSIFLAARYTFIPVIVSALGRVESLAVSMEGRCFGLHPTRTFRRRIPFGWVDALTVAASAAVAVLALAAM
jgi:energy-coupling factor transport system permease protein